MPSLSPADEELPRKLGALLRNPGLWPVILRAVWELGLARLAIGQKSARDLLEQPQSPVSLNRADPLLTCRVAWAVPRVAARLPWRADCLVQAIAARRWLAHGGVATRLSIGTRSDRTPGFEAHAWLCLDDEVITGGDTSGFVPLSEHFSQRGCAQPESSAPTALASTAQQRKHDDDRRAMNGS
jgi:hypothetical protein